MSGNASFQDKRPAGSASLSSRLFDGSVIAVLLILLFFVLIPMLWMIVTAFKTKGTAFQLEFLPRTMLLDPPVGAPLLSIANAPADGSPIVYLEWKDTSAISVRAEIFQNGSVIRANSEAPLELRSGLEGTWSNVASVKPDYDRDSPVEVVYTVNEKDEAGRVVATLRDGILVAAEKAPSQLVLRSGSELTIAVGNVPPTHTVQVDLFDKNALLVGKPRRVTLKLDTDGVYRGRTTSANEVNWQVVRTRPFSEALAAKYTLENFQAILGTKTFNFGSYFLNSLVVATAAGLLTVLICTLAGYAFAQFTFHGRDALFGMLLASMLVPGMIFMVPQFSITLSLGMMDSYAGMVVPHLANVFGLFLLRQYISQIPRDLFSAAEIDGARQHQIFQTIVIPICLPIMVTLFLLVFVGQWSNFLWQLIINTGQSEVLTLPVGLQQFKGQNANEWEKIMAGACFSIVPIAVLFLSLQKYFMEGLTAGAVKE